MKILIGDKYLKNYLNIENTWAGTHIANYYHIKSLAKIAEIDFIGNEDQEISNNIRCTHIDLYDPEQARQKIYQQEYDGILFLTPYFDSIAITREICDLPIIIRTHSLRPQERLVLLCLSLLEEYDAIMPVSKWSCEHLVKFAQDDQLRRYLYSISNGVDLDLFKPIDKKEAKYKVAEMLKCPKITENPVVGFVSRFQPEKGSVSFLKAASRVPDAIFLVVGHTIGDYSNLIGENVIFTGAKSHFDLPLFYNALDVFCFPSIMDGESFGLTVLEAMACGVVPIVSNFDGPPEVIGDTGYTIETEENDLCGLCAYVSVDDFVDKIKILLGDEEKRIKLSKAARQRSLDYSWDRVASDTLSLFQRLKIIREETLVKRSRIQNSFPVRFMQSVDPQTHVKTTVGSFFNICNGRIGPMRMMPQYSTDPETALAYSLLRYHRRREVEIILYHFLQSTEKVSQIMDKIDRFLDSVP